MAATSAGVRRVFHRDGLRVVKLDESGCRVPVRDRRPGPTSTRTGADGSPAARSSGRRAGSCFNRTSRWCASSRWPIRSRRTLQDRSGQMDAGPASRCASSPSRCRRGLPRLATQYSSRSRTVSTRAALGIAGAVVGALRRRLGRRASSRRLWSPALSARVIIFPRAPSGYHSMRQRKRPAVSSPFTAPQTRGFPPQPPGPSGGREGGGWAGMVEAGAGAAEGGAPNERFPDSTIPAANGRRGVQSAGGPGWWRRGRCRRRRRPKTRGSPRLHHPGPSGGGREGGG